MTRIGLMWRPEFASNLADGWTANGTVEPHDERSRVRAAGSMDTTIRDLARFTAYMVRGGGLSKAAARERIRGTLAIASPTQFPTLQPDAPVKKRVHGLAAGIGVIAFSGPQGCGWFKGGHNESTGNTLVCLKRGECCVLILSNDVRAERAFPMLVKAALGNSGVPFRWEYGTSAGQ